MSLARLLVPPQARRGELVTIRIAIQHPMETGYRHDAMGNTIPKNTINNLVCRYNGAEVFRAEMGSGITANPYLEFSVIATGSGNIEFAWVDDAGEKGSVSAPLVVIA
jgi:sulfur-oxidizing protein SoxZ